MDCLGEAQVHPPPFWPRPGGAVVGEDGVLGVVEAGSVVLADGEAKFSALCKDDKFLHDIEFTYFVTCAQSLGTVCINNI